MKKSNWILRLLLILALAPSAAAQTSMITASNIQNLAGQLLASGYFELSPVNSSLRPTAFTACGGGQVLPTTYYWPIANGALSGVAVPDTSCTTPSNVGYLVVIADANKSPIYQYPQPIHPTGSTWSFDAWSPSSVAQATPAGAILSSSAAPTAPCAAPSVFYWGTGSSQTLGLCVGSAVVAYASGGGGTSQAIAGLAYSPSDTTIVATWYTSGQSNSSLICGSKAAIDNNFQASVAFHQAIVTGLSPSTACSCTVTSGLTTSSPQSVSTVAAAARTPITAMTFGAPTATTLPGDTIYSFVSNDGHTYVTEDDGNGLTGSSNAGANMQVSELTTDATLTGLNTNLLTNYGGKASSSGTDGPGGAAQSNKASGIFGMGGALYLFANRDTYTAKQNAWYGNVLKSTDHGVTWNTWQNPPQISPNGVPPVPLGSYQWSPSTWGWCNPVRYAMDDGSNGYLTPGNRIDGADAFVYGSCTDGYWNNSSNLYMWRITRANFAAQNPGALQYWIGPSSPSPADFVNDANWTDTYGTPTAIYSAANQTSAQDITFVAGFNYYILGEWYQPTAGTSDDTVWTYFSGPTPAGPWTSIGTKTNNPSGYYNPVILHRTAATNTATSGAGLTIAFSGDYNNPSYYLPTYSGIILNPSVGYLIDQTAAAAGAWSVSHTLRAAYSGPLVNIERASDSTTEDVSATAGAINQSTINTFCSGTTCYVDKIYDQSGNALNVTQATQANMPIIYQSGAIVTSGVNGEVAMAFDGTNRFLSVATTTGGSAYETFEVENLASSISYGGAFALTDSSNSNCGATINLACFSMTAASTEAVESYVFAGNVGSLPITYGTQFLQGLIYNAGSLSGTINGGTAANGTGAASTLTGTVLVIGNAATNGSGTAWDGSISDVVLWATNLSSGERSAGVAVEQAFFGGLM